MAPNYQELVKALSPARLSTYEAACDSSERALELYVWNAQISQAFLWPLHICEIVIRNAVSEALAQVYGAQWPWSAQFQRHLPQKPREILIFEGSSQKQRSVNDVIASLMFGFWTELFHKRYEQHIWHSHIHRIFPNCDPGQNAAKVRKAFYDDLKQIRTLRNRISHHEPIFRSKLADDHDKIRSVIARRCTATTAWVGKYQTILAGLSQKPVLRAAA